jgi:hypothetical protein
MIRRTGRIRGIVEGYALIGLVCLTDNESAFNYTESHGEVRGRK